MFLWIQISLENNRRLRFVKIQIEFLNEFHKSHRLYNNKKCIHQLWYAPAVIMLYIIIIMILPND